MIPLTNEDSRHMSAFRTMMREARGKPEAESTRGGLQRFEPWRAAGKGRVVCTACEVPVHASARAKRTHLQGRAHAERVASSSPATSEVHRG